MTKEAEKSAESDSGFESNAEVQSAIQDAEIISEYVLNTSFPFLHAEQLFDLEITDGDLGGMVVGEDKNFYQFVMEISSKKMGIFRWLTDDELPDPESPPLLYVNAVYPKLKAVEVKMDPKTATGYAATSEGAIYLVSWDEDSRIMSLFPSTEGNLKQKGVNPDESKANTENNARNSPKPSAGRNRVQAG